jgi:hypothetical protein
MALKIQPSDRKLGWRTVLPCQFYGVPPIHSVPEARLVGRFGERLTIVEVLDGLLPQKLAVR